MSKGKVIFSLQRYHLFNKCLLTGYYQVQFALNCNTISPFNKSSAGWSLEQCWDKLLFDQEHKWRIKVNIFRGWVFGLYGCFSNCSTCIYWIYTITLTQVVLLLHSGSHHPLSLSIHLKKKSLPSGILSLFALDVIHLCLKYQHVTILV